jgi:hypothetical protein
MSIGQAHRSDRSWLQLGCSAIIAQHSTKSSTEMAQSRPAKALGLTVPQWIRLSADEVIE